LAFTPCADRGPGRRIGGILAALGPDENLPPLDFSVAHPARIYDYWLGGENNYVSRQRFTAGS